MLLAKVKGIVQNVSNDYFIDGFLVIKKINSILAILVFVHRD